MKKSYHSACKEEKLAASRETNSKLESNNNPETQKKLQEKVEKCQQEVQKVESANCERSLIWGFHSNEIRVVVFITALSADKKTL